MPRKKTRDEFINQANIKHNNIYNYDKVIYKGSSKKVIITCLIHGDFEQIVNNHLAKSGCPECGLIIFQNKKNKNREQFVKEANIKHNNIYNYDKVIYKGSSKKVIITCLIHKDFEQRVANHLRGQRCPKCAQKIINKKQTKNIEQFIKEATKKHNNFYNYDKVIYIGSTKKVIITCPIHKDFKQNSNSHLNGSCCPKCVKNKFSKTQIEWLKLKIIIDNTYIQHSMNDKEYKINSYKVDGYSKDLNKVYEFHGDYWHGNPKRFNRNDINKTCKKSYGELYDNTLIRINDIKELGYKVEEMWELDWNNYKKLMKSIRKYNK